MKNVHLGSTLDSLFEETGELEEVRTLAAKKMIVDQYLAAMDENKLTISALSRRMSTSRAAVKRLLDPKSTGVTLDSLGRAASALGKDLEIRLTEKRSASAKRGPRRSGRRDVRSGKILKRALSK